jgi:hypothetical protein
LTNARERLVDGNADQPCREPRPPLEIAQMLVRTHVGILHHILGFAVVVEEGACRTIDTRIVAMHEEFEQLPFTRANARNDLLVGQRHCRWRSSEFNRNLLYGFHSE